ncbi:MAG: DNA-methyltransferase [Anaerolineaceae bacterium]
MNKICYGDNLEILKNLPDESIDLIYIDPPFNTGKTQSRTTIKTIRSENGDRKGFQGNSYETIELGTKSYKDSFDLDTVGLLPIQIENAYKTIAPFSSVYFLEKFLHPRLIEAYRLLKPNGSLYFHIDYREVHYCKILLDNIFGRNCFMNEIIWAYDFGGRARSKWPAKHDNILFYVKDPKNYIFDTSKIEREDYMAPGLVGFEKAQRGKLPTDTWFWTYVGTDGMKNSDTWWMTIVGTNSKERIGYPTQKPLRLIDRMVQVSTFPGQKVLDFFAGSGTIGESCLANNREFILIDNNPVALEVMAKRFSGLDNIEWIDFDPSKYQTEIRFPSGTYINVKNEKKDNEVFNSEFQMLASTASNLQEDWEEKSDLWKNSPMEWITHLPARSKGKLARRLISSWLSSKGIEFERVKNNGETIIINNIRYAIKFSTLWKNGIYQFQQIKVNGPDHIICFGISPFTAHCWIILTKDVVVNGNIQHKGASNSEYWIAINPKEIPKWLEFAGGKLEEALVVIKSQKKQNQLN